jgi:DNA-binding transcriptional LysR family regulator
MNLKQFRYVLTLASEGSFSRAAEALNIKQPSLSQYIKNVEKEVGMSLFDRSGGDVRLTDAGRDYIDIGRKILDLEHQLEGKLSDLSSFRSGTISIGISAHRSVALMPPVVIAFKKLYPGITLRIIERYRADLLDAAEHGEFDLVITTLPVNTELFTTELVFVEENVVATRKEMKSEVIETRKYPVISASRLNSLPFVMLNDNHLMQKELNELIKAYNLNLKKEVECTSLETLLEMVKAGVGAAFVPACLTKDPSLHYYSIVETTPKREIVLMYRKEQYLSKAVLDLKQLIHELLG